MDLQNLLTALYIRGVDLDLPVKTSGSQQGRIQNIRPVGGGKDDNALGMAEAIHLHQQLVQGLLLFIVAAAETCSALAAHGVDLVNEDNGRSQLLRLLKQVADTAGAHAHIHFNEIRSGNGEELHPRLSGYCPGKQGLAGARRTYQQNAVGNARADVGKFLGIAKEVYDFLKLFFFLVRTGNVSESHFLTVRHAQNSSGSAEVCHRIIAIHAAHDQGPQNQQNRAHNQQRKHNIIGCKTLCGNEIIAFQNALIMLLLEKALILAAELLRLGQIGPDLRAAIHRTAQLQSDGVVLHHKTLDLLLLKQLHNPGIGHGVSGSAHKAAGPGKNQKQNHQIQNGWNELTIIQCCKNSLFLAQAP